MNKKAIKEMKAIYATNKESKIGDTCTCPSCGTSFVKEHRQQAFCKTQPKTYCKDRYWNNVTPHKRCNTTRISPASRLYMNSVYGAYAKNDYMYDEHPFSSEGLGQWGD